MSSPDAKTFTSPPPVRVSTGSRTGANHRELGISPDVQPKSTSSGVLVKDSGRVSRSSMLPPRQPRFSEAHSAASSPAIGSGSLQRREVGAISTGLVEATSGRSNGEDTTGSGATGRERPDSRQPLPADVPGGAEPPRNRPPAPPSPDGPERRVTLSTTHVEVNIPEEVKTVSEKLILSEGKSFAEAQANPQTEITGPEQVAFTRAVQSEEMTDVRREAFWNVLVDAAEGTGWAAPTDRQIVVESVGCGKFEDAPVLQWFFSGGTFGSIRENVRVVGSDRDPAALAEARDLYHVQQAGLPFYTEFPQGFEFVLGDAADPNVMASLDEPLGEVDAVIFRNQNLRGYQELAPESWENMMQNKLNGLSPTGIMILTSYDLEDHQAALTALGEMDCVIEKEYKNTDAHYLKTSRNKSDAYVIVIKKKSPPKEIIPTEVAASEGVSEPVGQSIRNEALVPVGEEVREGYRDRILSLMGQPRPTDPLRPDLWERRFQKGGMTIDIEMTVPGHRHEDNAQPVGYSPASSYQVKVSELLRTTPKKNRIVRERIVRFNPFAQRQRDIFTYFDEVVTYDPRGFLVVSTTEEAEIAKLSSHDMALKVLSDTQDRRARGEFVVTEDRYNPIKEILENLTDADALGPEPINMRNVLDDMRHMHTEEISAEDSRQAGELLSAITDQSFEGTEFTTTVLKKDRATDILVKKLGRDIRLVMIRHRNIYYKEKSIEMIGFYQLSQIQHEQPEAICTYLFTHNGPVVRWDYDIDTSITPSLGPLSEDVLSEIGDVANEILGMNLADLTAQRGKKVGIDETNNLGTVLNLANPIAFNPLPQE